MQRNTAYPKDTVGRVLTTKVPVFPRKTTVEKAITEVTRNASDYATVNYIYLLGTEDTLIGVVSIKNLLAAAKSKLKTPLLQIADDAVVSVRPHTHQESAAHKALKYNIKAIPVVDAKDKFLGVVESDQILAIMHEEKTEDMLKLSGIATLPEHLDDIMSLSVFSALKHRLPWLVGGLAIELGIAQVITLFGTSVIQNVIVATFIPMMLYTSSAVSQQVMAFMARDSATREEVPYFRYFLRQFFVAGLIAIVTGLLLGVASFALYQDIVITQTLSAAMAGTVLSAVVTGFFIPFMFIKLEKDPANASGPMGTALQDLFSVLIYFSIVSWLLV